jgi:exonuclease III
MRVVAWNIRAGGGKRADDIARQIHRWAPDLVALSEFRGTAPSGTLEAALAATGLRHQLKTADPGAPARNSLLMASRWHLRRLRVTGAPEEPGRWLVAAVDAPIPLAMAAMHVPNRVGGRKYPFLDAALACARRWRRGPALFVGDTNSGRRGLDEEASAFSEHEEGWFDSLAACGWADAFRHVHGDTRAYTWYSPNGRNGFRIDQAFVNRPLLPHLSGVAHVWAGATRGRRDVLSDHAALVVDLAEAPSACPSTPRTLPTSHVVRGKMEASPDRGDDNPCVRRMRS